jgi:hypothetical protein
MKFQGLNTQEVRRHKSCYFKPELIEMKKLSQQACFNGTNPGNHPETCNGGPALGNCSPDGAQASGQDFACMEGNAARATNTACFNGLAAVGPPGGIPCTDGVGRVEDNNWQCSVGQGV